MADISTHQQLDQMITGYWISQAIYAAAKFGMGVAGDSTSVFSRFFLNRGVFSGIIGSRRS